MSHWSAISCVLRGTTCTAYDYVIVGGGLSGLVVSNRLTEDPKKTVLVIEAGVLIPDDKEEQVLVPALIGATGKTYDWNITTQPIPGLNNRTFPVSSAKVVGGGTVINGMFFDRGSMWDYDSWELLGNEGWNWEGLEPYFKKSETYTPPPPESGIEYDPTTHGFSGPVHVSYPNFLYPQLKSIMKAWQDFGIPIPRDGNNGNAIGGFWVPNSLDPRDETRSFAKTAYHDVSKKRSNYHLIAGRQVTKILFDSNKRATGVIVLSLALFQAGPSGKPHQVNANAEVILAAGAVHTPKLLQLSGIGPAALLKQHGIPILNELPGVGSNFQDHPTVFLNYNVTIEPFPTRSKLISNATFNAEMIALYRANRTGPYTVSSGNTASFLPLPLIAPDSYRNLLDAAEKEGNYLDQGVPPEVIKGFEKQKTILLETFGTMHAGVDEFIVSFNVAPLVALQKPLSRGYIEIASTNPFDDPIVEYRALSNPLDVHIMVAALEYGRAFMASPGMALFSPIETTTAGMTAEELEAYVRATGTPTFSHPSCTCPMMPLEIGGCVDEKLRVHGVKGLRIVDASVFPLIPATHLMSSVYAVAERAADIIKGLV
ncbi:alcohol oxidase [Sphaerosporella brunnea]|uniref:Alcohol oxidase n=1 Tax=Sphaerosporella brunnea TaxID=1250544 RepID=A0A5J5EG73_9PEZI|nr:alcohol oxidase [Sphaerosporella brunnea]